MWLFDARQQFGHAPLFMALLGIWALWREDRPWAWLIATTYVVSVAFALTYNVGDSHVFFLPAHFVMAFAAGAGVASLMRFRFWRLDRRGMKRLAPVVVLIVSVGYTAWRGWTTWPVVDRHEDRRGERLIAQLATGIHDGNAILITKMNWQLENVLLYTGRHLRDDLTWLRLGDALTHWPLFVADNHHVGRDVVLDGAAARAVASLTHPIELVSDAAPPGLMETVAAIPKGAPYILTVLRPPREIPLDTNDLAAAVRSLNGGATRWGGSDFEIMAGLAGAVPEFHHGSGRPFHERFPLPGEEITVRMESWLPTDTFRRAGFGHLLRGRQRLMFLERGVNLVWMSPGGQWSQPYYAASLFAPQPRFRIPAATLQYARNPGLSATTIGLKLEGKSRTR
jgi:hypothetical protein